MSSPLSLHHFLPLLLIFLPTTESCAPQFTKELRYLDIYLGVKPDHEGKFLVRDEPVLKEFVESSDMLDCDMQAECLWQNAKTDNLLDDSDYFYFVKTDDKRFPIQIQPGNPQPPIGTHFALAGNTTDKPSSAVYLSAPVGCQKGLGTLSFSYWLYNVAKLEVVLVRAATRRKQLQVLVRPQLNCHFLRQQYDVCNVTIPAVEQPFRIGIRAFNLRDNNVGSMALINDIHYRATICSASPLPNVFNARELEPLPYTEPQSLKDFDCPTVTPQCRWSMDDPKEGSSEWKEGQSTFRWEELTGYGQNSSRPTGSFYFLAVDSLMKRPYGKLRSDLIPCTKGLATLSMKYWTRGGTQVEVCSADEHGTPLSCAYLNEEDQPGPVNIDIEPYDKPFRFTIEMIAFDRATSGLVAIQDIRFTGLLCTEEPAPVPTTIDPPTISQIFALQSYNAKGKPYPLSLDCDFTQDNCGQWVNEDGKFEYGSVPEDTGDQFEVSPLITGNLGMFVFDQADKSRLYSREVPCAFDALVTVTYQRSERGSVKICALGNCVQGKAKAGRMALEMSSRSPFIIEISAESDAPAAILISDIHVAGDVCPLKTLEQTFCQKLQCNFHESMCGYKSVVEMEGDTPISLNVFGAGATLEDNAVRAELRSPEFELSGPASLHIHMHVNTFGVKVFLCGDETRKLDRCTLLLGPRISDARPRHFIFDLDESAHRFSLVVFHDKSAQFGSAPFSVESIDIRSTDGYQLCF